MIVETAPQMSVVDRIFESEQELQEGAMSMTATSVTAQMTSYNSRRVHPHGLDLVVMRLSLATLLWARRRADRSLMTHEEKMLQRALELELGDRADRSARSYARVI